MCFDVEYLLVSGVFVDVMFGYCVELMDVLVVYLYCWYWLRWFNVFIEWFGELMVDVLMGIGEVVSLDGD